MSDTTKNIVIRVKSETDDAKEGFKSLKSELREIEREMNRLAEAGMDGTEQFQKMSQRAGELKDQISDTKARINALASDTFQIDAMTGAVEGLASGFAIVEGATALFGSENEDLQKSLLKVQGAMSLLQGVQSIQNLLQKESATYIAVTTSAQKIYNAVVGESTGALKQFRTAMLGLGVGAILVGIGTIIAYWDDLKKMISSTSESTKIASDTFEGIGDKFGDSKVKVDELVREFEKYNTSTKRRKEILDELSKISPNYFKTELKNINDVRNAQLKFNEALLQQSIIEASKNKISELTKDNIDKLAEAQNKVNLSLEQFLQQSGFTNAYENAKKNGKNLQRFTDSYTEYIKGKQIELSELNKELAKEIEPYLKVSENASKHLQELGGNAVETTEKTTKAVGNSSKAVQQHLTRTIDAMNTLTIEPLKMVESVTNDGLTRINGIKDSLLLSLNAILESTKSSFKQQRDALDFLYKNKLITQQEYLDKTMALDELELKSKTELAKGIANVFMELSDVVGKSTRAGKIFASASALINTFLGITEVLKAPNPYPEPYGTALKIASATAIGLNGFKQVKEINKVNVPGGGGGGQSGSMPTLTSGTQPSQQTIGSQLSNSTKVQLNQFENIKQPVVRAYVVESEMTEKQGRQKRLKQTAMIK